MKIWGKCLSFLSVIFLISSFVSSSDFSDDGVWQQIPEHKIQQTGIRTTSPHSYLIFQLNRDILKSILKEAPLEFTSDAITKNISLSLPMPDGRFARFRIVESPIIEPALAAKYPEIKTFSAQGIDDRTMTARLGWTSGGFHAFGLTNDRSFYVGIYQFGDKQNYISYWGDKDSFPAKQFECLVNDQFESNFKAPLPEQPNNGGTLRSYTTAIAATGEYTQKFPPGTKASALNDGIIPTINSFNAILESEFTVRLVLIGNEDKIIFTDGATDPYTANDPSAMLAQNQATVDGQIGSANYDIGHVFGGVGGSGVAYLGVACNSTFKAQGVSTYSNPMGTTFLVDLVAHEFGHQFNASHSFNGTTGSCGGNRSGGSAWEPGSGSTIMSYSGSCGSENLQSFSDPYYHVGSYDQVNAHISNTTCDDETSTGNNPPNIDAGPNYTIPQSTPFTLTASGSDPDGDAITYSWEEKDLGTASPPLTDDGSRPIFRSWPPKTINSRTFPRLQDVLDGGLIFGEAWATTDRTLNFRVMARDNHASAGGSAYDSMVVTVKNGAGPFLVTNPNTNVTWNGGTTENVTWDVAGTNSSPINTANVKILLSTDSGLTFPIELAASTPNDGSQNITVPLVATTKARVNIEAIGNIFFDISNTDFTITNTGCPTITVNPATLPNGILGSAYNQTITASGGNAPYTYAVTAGSLPTGLTLNPSTGQITGTPTASGTFNFNITATDANDCTGVRSYSVMIGCPAVTVLPATLPGGTIGDPYNQTVSGSGGTAPYTFAVSSGSLPNGLSLNSTTGQITGTPTTSGVFNFTITATDVFGCIGSTGYSVTIGCETITLNPATLPDGLLGAAYNQTITATGGTAPYTFAVTSGSLPPGLTLASDGTLSGTPSATGNYSFVITATDANTCTGSQSYNISITSTTCLFCDDFNDDVLSTGWTYIKPNWTENGGFLAGTPTGRKAIAIATPIFGGCSNCTVEAEMQTAGGPGNRMWLIGWYVDKKNTIELLMKEEKDVWILKQRVNGRVIAKAKGAATIDSNTTYDAKIAFDGNQFQVYINNTLLITLPKAAGTNPNGTVGFQLKLTTGSFNSINVN